MLFNYLSGFNLLLISLPNQWMKNVCKLLTNQKTGGGIYRNTGGGKINRNICLLWKNWTSVCTGNDLYTLSSMATGDY